MEIVLNGAPHTLSDPTTTIAALLASLELDPSGVAVAVNLQVVPRGSHAARVLAAGERVDIIRAVGGG